MATDRPDPPPENDATTATLCAAVIGVVFTIGAFFVGGGRTAMSVAVGAAIAVANLVMMRAIVRAVIQAPVDPEPPEEADKSESEPGPAPDPRADHKAEGRRGGAAWGIFAVLKLFLLFGGIYLLLTKGLVDPIPLVVGYGVLPLGITASTAVRSLRPRRPR